MTSTHGADFTTNRHESEILHPASLEFAISIAPLISIAIPLMAQNTNSNPNYASAQLRDDFLLNVGPDESGGITESSLKTLEEIGKLRKEVQH